MKISRSEAVLLPNKTYPIHGEPGYYLGALDVFHQLHCLVSKWSFPQFLNGAANAGDRTMSEKRFTVIDIRMT